MRKAEDEINRCRRLLHHHHGPAVKPIRVQG
jgi:hypothetical protein